MSDQQQENEITTAQTAPAAPVASDQAAMPAPVQASVPEAPKAASTPASASAEKVAPAAGDEDAAKPKRRTTRATRTKRTVADPSAPISDEVAQARALAQISEAQVVRARRRAAEREAAALTELAAPVVSEAPAANATAETRVTDQSVEKPAARTRRRVATKAQQPVEQGTSDAAEAPTRPVAGESAQFAEPATRFPSSIPLFARTAAAASPRPSSRPRRLPPLLQQPQLRTPR